MEIVSVGKYTFIINKIYIMKKVVWSIILALGVSMFSFQTASAQPVLDPDNPFLNVKDAGSAEDVAVIGAKDGEAQEDALINVIK